MSARSAIILAAGIPGIPSAPTYVSSTATTITIAWVDDTNNGGSVILNYNIYVDTGSLTVNTFNLVGQTSILTYTLDNTVLTQFLSGSMYRFRITAVNVLGESSPSNEIRISLEPLPPQPATPTIDQTKSTLTSLYVSWISPGDGA
jgi:hypothetical protein